MRILSVAYPFAPVGPDAVGGAEQILSAIDHDLVAAGHDSVVIACAGSHIAGRHVEIPATTTIDVRRQAALHAALRDIIAAESAGADLVHLHGIDCAAYLPAAGPRVLITLHLPPDWYPPEIATPTRPRTWVHAVSAAQHAACPASAALLPPVPNGVPVARLAGAHHARRGFALILGRICPEKGQDVALRATRRAGVPLLIAGSAFGHAAHQRYMADEVVPLLDTCRRWIGPVGFARKRRLLSAARCVLIPSRVAETSSLVAMEAASCGTPVIAFAAGALPETVRDGHTGFIVDSEIGMASAIARAKDIDPEACRQHARRTFDNRTMTAAYTGLYQSLARA